MSKTDRFKIEMTENEVFKIECLKMKCFRIVFVLGILFKGNIYAFEVLLLECLRLALAMSRHTQRMFDHAQKNDKSLPYPSSHA